MLLDRFGKRSAVPVAPPEVAQEVELYARESGRTGSVAYVVPLSAWEVRLSLRSNDARMIAYQQGMASEPPVESVLLVETNPKAGQRTFRHGQYEVERPFRALDVVQMGAGGVRAFLEQGNAWSGRGEFRSPEHAAQTAAARDEDMRAKNKQDAREDVRTRVAEERPWYARKQHEKIARQVVDIDLKEAP